MTLLDVVARLASWDAEATIYAVRPWTCESEAVVMPEPEEGDAPADYFLEVFVAREILEGLPPLDVRAKCERLIEYAVRDA